MGGGGRRDPVPPHSAAGKLRGVGGNKSTPNSNKCLKRLFGPNAHIARGENHTFSKIFESLPDKHLRKSLLLKITEKSDQMRKFVLLMERVV